MEARTATTINAPPETVYEAWRDVTRLPQFMYHLEAVTSTDDRRSHWVANAPAGTTVEWDAEITEDVPGERIAWRSVDGASVENSGVVELVPAPGGRGTELRVTIQYTPPGGALGSALAKLLGEEPTQQVSDDVRRFKQLTETGEIARSDGAPWGTRTANIGHQQDAQPPDGQGSVDLTQTEVRA
jgi:uncharacterized membrane protein